MAYCMSWIVYVTLCTGTKILFSEANFETHAKVPVSNLTASLHSHCVKFSLKAEKYCSVCYHNIRYVDQLR